MKKKLSVFIVLIILLLVGVLNTIQTHFISDKMRNSTSISYEENCREIAKCLSKNVSGKITEYMKQMRMYTESDIAKTQDTEQIVQYLREHTSTRSSDFKYIGFCDIDGHFYTDLGSETVVTDRSYYKAIITNGEEENVDNPVTSKTNGNTVIHISKAVKTDDKTTGFFTGIIEIGAIQNIVNDIRIGQDGYAFLIDQDGNIIAHPNSEYEMNVNLLANNGNKELSKAVQNLLSGKSGSGWINNNNQSSFITYIPVDGTPWGIMFSISKQQVYKTATELSSIMIITAFIFGIVLTTVLGIIVYKSLRPLDVLEKTITEIASGNADLTQRIEVNSNNEIGSVVKGFNNFSMKLQAIVTELKKAKLKLRDVGETLKNGTRDTTVSIIQMLSSIQNMQNAIDCQTASVEETAGAVNQITANIASLDHMIATSAAGVTEASAAVEEMIGNISSVNTSMERMSVQFKNLESDIKKGISKQLDVHEKVTKISNESETLQEANIVISNIAEQTNLLAMNAAIEAAHAGEAGKGFSVVSDEIRKLSVTSSTQSRKIGEQLKKIQDTIASVVNASLESRTSFTSISEGIASTDNLVCEIKTATEEMEEGSKQINIALSDMINSTHEVKNAADEMASGSKAILVEIESLQNASENMKQEMGEMSIGANKINETGSSLKTISDDMENSISDIGKQIDQFTV